MSPPSGRRWPRRAVDGPRIEYALSVVADKKVPKTAPGDLEKTGQVKDAQEFIKLKLPSILRERIPKAKITGYNTGLASAGNATMTTQFGAPRDDYSQECQPVTNKDLAKRIVSKNVGPFTVPGLDKAVESLTTVMKSVLKDERLVYRALGNGRHAMLQRYTRAARRPTSPTTRGARPSTSRSTATWSRGGRTRSSSACSASPASSTTTDGTGGWGSRRQTRCTSRSERRWSSRGRFRSRSGGRPWPSSACWRALRERRSRSPRSPRSQRAASVPATGAPAASVPTTGAPAPPGARVAGAGSPDGGASDPRSDGQPGCRFERLAVWTEGRVSWLGGCHKGFAHVSGVILNDQVRWG